MLKDYNKYKVLRLFFDDPLGEYGLREISRKIRLAPLSVKNYLNGLENEGYIQKRIAHDRPFYYAAREAESFRLYKKANTVFEIGGSGLLDFLTDNV